MEQEAACVYLRDRCFVADASSSALRADWQHARARLAGPHTRAGHPEIAQLPARLSAYVQRVRNSEGYEALAESFDDLEFVSVEIGPLLAYQPHIETERAAALCANFSGDVDSLEDLAEICLPIEPESFEPQVSRAEGSVIIHSESLNLRIVRSGIFELDSGTHDVVAGVYLGMGCPLLHVAQFEGRFYLRNGFHRVYALQRMGVRRIPCIVFPVRRFEDTGAVGRGMTFDRETLTGDFAPTCAHYHDERAYPVKLRKTTRIITASWAESLIIER